VTAHHDSYFLLFFCKFGLHWYKVDNFLEIVITIKVFNGEKALFRNWSIPQVIFHKIVSRRPSGNNVLLFPGWMYRIVSSVGSEYLIQ
jgi:hypothetical protein